MNALDQIRARVAATNASFAGPNDVMPNHLKERETLLAAVDAALALHECVDVEQFYNDASGASRSYVRYVCAHCEHNTAYPCETVAAITTTLGATK